MLVAAIDSEVYDSLLIETLILMLELEEREHCFKCEKA